MVTVLVGGAGGAPSEGVIRSLLESRPQLHVVGMGSDKFDLVLSSASNTHLVKRADAPDYADSLFGVVRAVRPDVLLVQNDIEVRAVSALRRELEEMEVRTGLPSTDAVEVGTDKYRTYLELQAAGVPVPETRVIKNPEDVHRAIAELAKAGAPVWWRSNRVSGGGLGSIASKDRELVEGWISHWNGWGHFLGAEYLSPDTLTWQSVWWEGELVSCQQRRRIGWVHGNRTASGVTGVTHVGETICREDVHEFGVRAVRAIDAQPNGAFGVDFCLGSDGHPYVTEINVGRFFTTILFFTRAGLNMPRLLVDLVTGSLREFDSSICPLDSGLLWVRGMDTEPRLVSDRSAL